MITATNLISGASGCAVILAIFGSWIMFTKAIMKNKRRALAFILLKYAILLAAFYLLSKFDLLNAAFFVGSLAGILIMLAVTLAMHRSNQS